jgi:hypothetical protein
MFELSVSLDAALSGRSANRRTFLRILERRIRDGPGAGSEIEIAVGRETGSSHSAPRDGVAIRNGLKGFPSIAAGQEGFYRPD